ncbi:histidinol-phosphate transaminase [Candidatus Puniceispirillum sp.]|uniref:histidinol-phosphate transaminase n=1 Tax=Candidatus Puniceispirillum sp. TaxID=2026719 RepID=UPI003F69C5B7
MTTNKNQSASAIVNRARPEILAMKGYSSARSLQTGTDTSIFLDANECPFEPFIGAHNLARYPRQQPIKLAVAICDWLDISTRNLTVTRGADEAIECLMRAFCVPNTDNIVICPPTFAMYRQSAILHAVETREAPLNDSFGLDIAAIDKATDANTKMIFICSPNNPTGNVMARDDILSLCAAYADQALIVLDETYIQFAEASSLIPMIESTPNLVILRTLSKSHAAAGLRCGAAIARGEITQLLQKVLAPYPLASPVVDAALAILTSKNHQTLAAKRDALIERRDRFIPRLAALPMVDAILPSDANFILVRVQDADSFYATCLEAGIVVRNQSHQPGLANSIRISIGTEDEMNALVAALSGDTTESATDTARTGKVIRTTSETAISVSVNLDKASPVNISTGIGFYDHMLDQIAKHGGFSLEVECDGDLHIDAHHTVEDCAIALGQAIRTALGDKRGINRYGFMLPMDETLVTVALDLSGRFYLDFKADFPATHVGDLPTDMVPHFFYSLAEHMQANLHISVTGENAHHMVEACFKGFGRTIRQAVRREGSELPSTKGVL